MPPIPDCWEEAALTAPSTGREDRRSRQNAWRSSKDRGAARPAVITSGGNLKARYVIHTVGPIWRGGKSGETQTLRNAYYNSLELARETGVKTVAFPSISTGVYRYPLQEAAGIALATIIDYIREPYFDEVRMVLFGTDIYRIYAEVLRKLLEQNGINKHKA